MAAVSQTGSRAGLISAVVVFVVLWLVFTIMFFVANSKAASAEKFLKEKAELTAKVAKPNEESDAGNLVDQWAKDDKNATYGYAGRSAYDILKSQRDALASRITGQNATSADDAQKALDIATLTIENANKTVKPAAVSVPNTSLTAAIGQLATAVSAKSGDVGALNQKLLATNEQLTQQIAAYKKELEEHKKNLEAANATVTVAQAELKTYQGSKDQKVAELEKSLADQATANRDALEAVNNQIAAANGTIETQKKLIATLTQQIAIFRPKDIGNSIIRRPDGKITMVARNNIVYINLGQGQQISPGMTFEIYDPREGIPVPSAATPEDEMPTGKGSLEVVRVSQGSSECRIIKMQLGQQPFEGDLIGNLIYDPNTKLAFKVYGEFDIDQNNAASVQEGEVLKRLVGQWGGVVTDKLDIDTDFVVLGKEPVLPELAKDPTPEERFRWEQQKKKLDDYNNERNRALELHIPVLNQNRFLYYIGYFDQAKK